jgi:hypothetical protein
MVLKYIFVLMGSEIAQLREGQASVKSTKRHRKWNEKGDGLVWANRAIPRTQSILITLTRAPIRWNAP